MVHFQGDELGDSEGGTETKASIVQEQGEIDLTSSGCQDFKAPSAKIMANYDLRAVLKDLSNGV